MSSVMEELRSLERHIVSRMEELRPLVAEYQELEQIAQRLGLDTSTAAEPAAKPTPPKPRAKAQAAKRKPAARRPKPGPKAAPRATERVGTRAIGAQRREHVLTLIGERPGITVPDISGELGVDAPPLYRVVRKLQSEGLITKQGKELRLA